MEREVKTRVLPHLQNLLNKLARRTGQDVLFTDTQSSHYWMIGTEMIDSIDADKKYPELAEFHRIINEVDAYHRYTFPEMYSKQPSSVGLRSGNSTNTEGETVIASFHVGQVGIAHCTNRLLGRVYYENALGGTEEIPLGDYPCRVTKAWKDYECGWRGLAVITDPAIVKELKLPSATIFINQWTFKPA